VQHDVIGDVHGSYPELLSLLEKLGYRLVFKDKAGLPKLAVVVCPKGRRLVFVGDLINRGPSSILVLNLVMQLVDKNAAVAVKGNHEMELLQALRARGKSRKCHQTIRALERQSQGFQKKVLNFLKAMPWKYETEELIVVHAAFRTGSGLTMTRRMAVFGDTRRSRNTSVRNDRWVQEYKGTKTIVHGHIPMNDVAFRRSGNGAWVVGVDTDCSRGNDLSALRFPELLVVSVPHQASKKPVAPRQLEVQVSQLEFAA
jgi:protein phosphatase